MIENSTVISLPDGTLEIKKTINKELIELELLEEEAGEPINDMPNNEGEDDSGSLFEDSIDNLESSNNELIIKLKNTSSEEKLIIIKYTK